MSTAYIGLGSNLDDPLQQLKRAMNELGELAEDGIECSSLYRTGPIGLADQPDFLNAVCRIETGLGPEELLARLLQIEAKHGRRRDGLRDGPRTLDLDLLLYDDRVLSSAGLSLPHPRLHERAFVLYPLFELNPELSVPGHGPVAELMRACRDQRIERLDSGHAQGRGPASQT
ncbi:MAG: 2-amino-4-hydroxy-6-hydroxymethyldihydropteridine diphosphokinase [Acidiferrobacteraceae bacterium]